ncbi:cytochrome c, partial [bacterium]|nr:cytochrome c [bacterium]
RNPSFLKTISNSELKRIVKEGRKGTQMTAWKSEAAGLTEKQIDEIVKYVAKDRPSEKSRPFNVAKIKSDIERGAEIYNNRCALCHGEEGKGGENLLGMTLRDSALSPEFIAITVRDGRKGTPMVPFGNGGIGLSNQEIADTVAYVKNLTNDKK